jgi:hypothetical protein
MHHNGPRTELSLTRTADLYNDVAKTFLFSMTTTMEKRERLVITVATIKQQAPPNFDYVTTTSLFISFTAMDWYRTAEGVMCCQVQVVIVIASFVVWCVLPNVSAKWSAFRLAFFKVLRSNLGPEIGCPNLFVVFLSSSRQMLLYCHKVLHSHFHWLFYNLSFVLSFNSMSFIIYLSSCHSIQCSRRIWKKYVSLDIITHKIEIIGLQPLQTQ